MFKTNKDTSGLFGGIVTAYVILILHVVLIALVGVLVLFFGGLMNYMGWVLLLMALCVAAGGYYYFRRIRAGARRIREDLNKGPFQGRPVEVSLLGGIATVKLGRPETPPMLDVGEFSDIKQLEDPTAVRIRELSDLARLLEEGHITSDEYNTLKKQIFQS